MPRRIKDPIYRLKVNSDNRELLFNVMKLKYGSQIIKGYDDLIYDLANEEYERLYRFQKNRKKQLKKPKPFTLMI